MDKFDTIIKRHRKEAETLAEEILDMVEIEIEKASADANQTLIVLDIIMDNLNELYNVLDSEIKGKHEESARAPDL